MNVYVAVGLLIVAMGSGVAIYGQYVKSRADSSASALETDEKLQKIMSDIQVLKNSSPSPEVAEKIEMVEDEFLKWASEFGEKKSKRKVDFERAKLDQVALEMKLSEQYRPFLELARQTLEKAVMAYNAKNQGAVVCELKAIPENLYALSSPAGSMAEVGKIVFQPDVAWHVRFATDKPAREGRGPRLAIFIGDSKSYLHGETSYISIRPSFATGSYQISFDGPQVPSLVGVDGEYPMAEYEKTLRAVLLKIFEAQMLALPETQ